MSKRHKSESLAAIHETVSDLHRAGLVDIQTMRRFDERCLSDVPKLSADEIKAIRLESKVSQAVFARYLNVSVGIVSQWERGEKSPSGPALKLLSIIRRKGLGAVS